MKPAAKTLIVSAVALAAGLAAGYFAARSGIGAGVRPADPTARAALAELLSYCGQGAKAARKVVDLVRVAAGGGEALIPLVAEAERSAPAWNYELSGWSIDPRGLEISLIQSRRAALLEVAGRIGGDAAMKVLMEGAVRADDWIDRVVAVLFLARYHERKDVADFLAERLRLWLIGPRNDPELVNDLQVLRGRLPAASWEVLERAFVAGWADESTGFELSNCLIAMNRERAADLFQKTLANDDGTPRARLTAAGALALLREHRPTAAALIIRARERGFARSFLNGLRYGRPDEIERYRETFQSGDPARWRSYCEERIDDQNDARRIMDEIAAAMGEKDAEALGIPKLRKDFDAAIEDGRRRQAALDKQRR